MNMKSESRSMNEDDSYTEEFAGQLCYNHYVSVYHT